MKKKLFALSLVIVVLLSAIVLVNSQKEIDFIDANVEALADGEESSADCGQSYCGKCYYEVKAWPFRKCKWSGDQSDSCECDKEGWIG